MDMTTLYIFALFLGVGFLAQLVDGALGMAYGVISSTVLLAFGVPPAHASAAVHAAEMATTGASGLSHHYHRNIDWKLFLRLTPFGVAGGVLGAYVLTGIDASIMRPLVTIYLGLVGVWILARSYRRVPSKPVPMKLVPPLGLTGGFLDAAGGGGWGPIVTTGLIGAGGPPRFVIGTVNTSEFVITTAVSITFLLAILSGRWDEGAGFATLGASIAGLIVGGLIAAPLAGKLVSIIPETVLLRMVGVTILAVSAFQAWQLLT
jgi:uncharacterized protein